MLRRPSEMVSLPLNVVPFSGCFGFFYPTHTILEVLLDPKTLNPETNPKTLKPKSPKALNRKSLSPKPTRLRYSALPVKISQFRRVRSHDPS